MVVGGFGIVLVGIIVVWFFMIWFGWRIFYFWGFGVLIMVFFCVGFIDVGV